MNIQLALLSQFTISDMKRSTGCDSRAVEDKAFRMYTGILLTNNEYLYDFTEDGYCLYLNIQYNLYGINSDRNWKNEKRNKQ